MLNSILPFITLKNFAFVAKKENKSLFVPVINTWIFNETLYLRDTSYFKSYYMITPL